MTVLVRRDRFTNVRPAGGGRLQPASLARGRGPAAPCPVCAATGLEPTRPTRWGRG